MKGGGGAFQILRIWNLRLEVKVDWTDLPVDVGVAEIICGLLSKIDTATPNQSEPIINLELDDFNF